MGLVTSQEIKSKTSMGGNTDSDKFMHLLDDVQVMVLENVLGTALYDKIVLDFNEGGTNNLAGDYLTMFTDYIKPVLWHSVYAEYLRDGIVLAQNGGIFTNSPEGATQADMDNVKYSAKNAQSKADTYIDRLTRFLCDSNIAEFDDAQANDYDQKPTNISTISGWYLGGNTNNNSTYGSGGSSDEYLIIE